MKSRKRKPLAANARRAAKLEQELKAVEAQIALLEKDASLRLAVQDHFVLWRRPNLFAPWPLGVQH
jgi:GAF domain-containing protein